MKPLSLAWGVAHHDAMALHFRALMNGVTAPEEEVVQRFLDSMLAAKTGPTPLQEDEDGTGFDFALTKGVEMVRAALADDSARSAHVLGVEVPFLVDIYDPATGEVLDLKLKGFMDLVLDEGHRTICELKTAGRAYAADELRFDHQRSAYSFASRQLGWGEVDLRWVIVTKGKAVRVQVEPTRRDERDEEIFLRTVAGTLRSIEAGVDFEIRGWQCRSCPYRRRCESER